MKSINVSFYREQNGCFQCVERIKLQHQCRLHGTPQLHCTETSAKIMVSKLRNAYTKAWYTFSSSAAHSMLDSRSYNLLV
jgi:hypothetical protein